MSASACCASTRDVPSSTDDNDDDSVSPVRGRSKSIQSKKVLSKTIAKSKSPAKTSKTSKKKPKIGIALGGGGAKGYAHIGILEVLTEAGIDCDIVTGTSSGALVGAAYASGRLAQLRELSKNISLRSIPRMLSPAWSREGLFSGKNAFDMLSGAISAETIEELDKPFGAVAVDLLKSELVEFTRGNLKTILRASISIPGLFTPVSLDGQLLVDGGIIEVVPVELNRKLGADFIIAVDLYSSLEVTTSPALPGAKEKKMNLIRVIESTLATIQRTSTQLRLKEYPAEIVICPAVAKVTFLDFHRSETVIEIGRNAALAALPKIRELLGKLVPIQEKGELKEKTKAK